MKKIIMVAITLIASVSVFGQSFTFKRCFSQIPGLGSNFLKIEGEVVITDTTINMTQNGIKSNMSVVTVVKGLGTQQFKMKGNEDIDFRFTLAPNPNPSRNEDYLFTMETKDKFTNTNTVTMYYLTSKK
jgi:hypothetical protein